MILKTLPFVDRVDRVWACANRIFGVRLGSDGFGDLRFLIFEFRFLIEGGAVMGTGRGNVERGAYEAGWANFTISLPDLTGWRGGTLSANRCR